MKEVIQDKFKNIDLVMPSEMIDFILQKDHLNIKLPSFHHLFALHRIENFRNIHKLPVPPHRKPVYDFIFITQGKSIRHRNFESFEVAPNTFFFLPAFEILSGEEMSGDIQGFYCHFDLKIFEHSNITKNMVNRFSFLQSDQNNLVKIDEFKKDTVCFLLNQLESQYRNVAKANFGLISGYLYTLFLELQNFAQSTPKPKDAAAQVTENYQEILRTQIYNFTKVSEFAEALSISPNYLNRCVTQTAGKTARDLYYQMLILEARVLLKQTRLTISEIAYKLGKKEPGDFSRLFKAKTGYSPKKYRDTPESEL